MGWTFPYCPDSPGFIQPVAGKALPRTAIALVVNMKNFEHGGNIRQLAQAGGRLPGEILDFSANINPLGPPEWLRPMINSQI